MKYLNRSLNWLKDDKTYKFHPKSSKLCITHLNFADDLLIFSRSDLKFITTLQNCFSSFSQTFGLQANPTYNSIYFGGVSPEDKQQILQKLGYFTGNYTLNTWVSHYLKITLYSSMVPLIERVMALDNWKAILYRKCKQYYLEYNPTTHSYLLCLQ